jgi:hypothetical protein
MKLFDRYPKPTPTKRTLAQRARQVGQAIAAWEFDATKYSSLALPLVCILVVLAIMGAMGQLDAADEVRLTQVIAQERDRQAAFEAGRMAGREEILGAMAAGAAALPRTGCSNVTTAEVKP